MGFRRRSRTELRESLGAAPGPLQHAVRKPASVIVREDGMPVVKDFVGTDPALVENAGHAIHHGHARPGTRRPQRLFKQAWESGIACAIERYYKWDRTVNCGAVLHQAAMARC